MTLPADYFDRLYADSPDPWGFASRWYEQRKYALTLAVLPARQFTRALEIGCSIGVLTAQLADRCVELTAVDPSAAALTYARTRVPSHVTLVQGSAPADWPPGQWDLVVLSEIGYYLSAPDLEVLLDRIEQHLMPGGHVVACHWRHHVVDYPRTGDEVHTALGRWPRLSRVEEEDFLLDVLAPGGTQSVARREGLL